MVIKKIIRQINRGVVLAVALIIGLVLYLLIDSYKFNSEKADIKSMVAAYAEEAESFNVFPEKFSKNLEKIPSEVLTDKKKENLAVIDRYLADSNITYYGTSANQLAIGGLDSSFKSNNEEGAFVLDCQFAILRVESLKKKGPDIAAADITVRTTLKTIGNPYYLNLFLETIANTDDMNYKDYEGNKNYYETDTEEHYYTSENTFTGVLFQKIDGKWKIVEADGIHSPFSAMVGV